MISLQFAETRCSMVTGGPGAKFHDGTLEVLRKGSLPSLCPSRPSSTVRKWWEILFNLGSEKNEENPFLVDEMV
jgi:hypothetical protein